MFHAWFGIFIIIAWEESIFSFLPREDKIYIPEALLRFYCNLSFLCWLTCPSAALVSRSSKHWSALQNIFDALTNSGLASSAYHTACDSTWRKQPMKSQVGAWFCLKCVLSPCAAKRSIWAPHSQLLFYSASFNCLNPFSACFVSESPHRGEHGRQ